MTTETNLKAMTERRYFENALNDNMIISEITSLINPFKVHPTLEDAVEYIRHVLGDDYGDDFWVGADGKSIVRNPASRVDFGIRIHQSLWDAIEAQMNLDPDVFKAANHQISMAVLEAIESGAKTF